jgi:mannose-6-phosphate isomerase-like protein (cupin superfamily)
MNMDKSNWVELVPGHVYRKSIGAKNLGVTMFWMKKPADPEKALIPKHKHGEEAFFVIKGSGTIIIEDREFRITEGDSLLIPAGAEHYGRLDDGELVILCIESPPRNGLRFYFNDVSKDGTL